MSSSLFSGLVAAPADPILGVSEKFRADPRPEKVNLGVGAYLTEEGVTPILEVVQEAEEAITAAKIPHTYIPISGLAGYGALVQKMVFGAESEIVLSGRAATVQTLGGTGALKVGMDFMHHICGASVGATSKPTWGNHNALLKMAGYDVKGYGYYDGKEGIDFTQMTEDLKALPAKTLVILHACCHNPTGYDLTHEEWDEVIKICQEKGLVPFLDMAYQGFGQGFAGGFLFFPHLVGVDVDPQCFNNKPEQIDADNAHNQHEHKIECRPKNAKYLKFHFVISYLNCSIGRCTTQQNPAGCSGPLCFAGLIVAKTPGCRHQLGRYFGLQAAILPVFRPFYSKMHPPAGETRAGGCKAVRFYFA